MSTDSLMNTYGTRAATLVKGEGAWLWDADGHKYLDALLRYCRMRSRAFTSCRRQSSGRAGNSAHPLLQLLCHSQSRGSSPINSVLPLE